MHSDINEGKWVSAQLPPDRAPTLEYVTWPGTYLPTFHFDNPVLGATDAPRIAGEYRPGNFARGFSGPVSEREPGLFLYLLIFEN